MKQLEKSLTLLEKYFKETSDKEIKETLNYFDSLDFEGPTWSEYINNFESEYDNLYSIQIDTPTINVNTNRENWINWTSESQSIKLESCERLVDIDIDKINILSIHTICNSPLAA